MKFGNAVTIIVVALIVLGLALYIYDPPMRACRDRNNPARVEACTWAIEVRSWLFLDQSSPYTSRGIAHRRNGEAELALADFNQAIALNPGHGGAYYERGLVYDARKDYDRAIADYSRAIDLYFYRNPRSWKSDFLNQRAIAYRNQGKFDLAMRDYDAAIDWMSGDPDFRYNRGLLFAAMGNNERAIADFTQAIEMGEGVSVAYRHDYLIVRADAYKSAGNLSAALADYDRAIGLLPLDAGTFYRRGLLHVAMNNPDAAMADLDRALVHFDPRKQQLKAKLDYLVDRGDLHKAKGEIELARSDYDEAIAGDPNFSRALKAREQLVTKTK